ncbi:hypothetical protein [Gracilibacillus thailandensis]|uniref:Uncharacterized protein n=1 Tax=Gracilibacillus thailandensis TaxID=563735 RepID=A0A6N7QZ65_9BACI|nr:hypothetical protein [Gracilibacillus thailandensis]MRI67433.1 hypothetical protein [Gracilibacillus thailandensis]
MNIIYKSLEKDYCVEFVTLTILSIITFKRIQKVEMKREKLKKEIKDKPYYRV